MKNIPFLLLFFITIIAYTQEKKDLLKSFQNNQKSDLESFKLVGYEEEGNESYYRYELPDKDHFSITFKEGEVVYLEINNISKEATSASLFDFNFQQTKLIDIHEKFNSVGFIYENRNKTKMNNQFVTFTCYKIKDSGLIISFVTQIDLVKLQSIESKNELLENLELFTVIVAKESYLDLVWGKEKIYPDSEIYEIGL